MRQGKTYKPQLKMLLKLARRMNLRVSIRPHVRNGDAGEYQAPSRNSKGHIVIYRKTYHSDFDVLLILLHELGHHTDFLVCRRIPDAYYYIADKEVDLWARKAIFHAEKKAIFYAEQLYWETGLYKSFPYWKVRREADFDTYQYEYWYKTGKWLTKKLIIKFLDNWNKKHKKNFILR